MFTALTTFVTGLLAAKGIKVAATILPHVAKVLPFVVLVVAILIGWFRADTLGRWLLVLQVANEALAAVLILLFVEEIAEAFAPLSKS
jgi:hypothetical protein